jgi:hypothetical protein
MKGEEQHVLKINSMTIQSSRQTTGVAALGYFFI